LGVQDEGFRGPSLEFGDIKETARHLAGRVVSHLWHKTRRTIAHPARVVVGVVVVVPVFAFNMVAIL